MSTTNIDSVPPGVVCTLEEYRNSDAIKGIFSRHCLTRGQTIGLMVVIACGLISCVAVLCTFALIIRNARFYRQQKREARGGSYYSLIEKPIDALLLSLFIADLIQAIGMLMTIHWVARGKTEVGSFCTAQGVVQQLGETTVAMLTCVIALYTLMSWYRRAQGSLRTAIYIIIGVWTLDLVLIIAGNVQYRQGNSNIPYSTPTPYWCWISSKYTHYQIIGEYMWFWIALVLSLLVYVILAWHEEGIQNHLALAYPLVYTITILPLSVVRFIGFSREQQGIDEPLPSVATFTVASIYSLGGLFNVALTWWTRKDSNLLHREQLEPAENMDLPMMPDIHGNGRGKEPLDLGHAQEQLQEGLPGLALHIA